MNMKRMIVANLALALMLSLFSVMAVAEGSFELNAPDSVARGEMLEVGLSGCDYYHLWIEPEGGGDWIGEDYWFAGDSMGIGTGILEEGRYLLQAEGYIASEDDETIENASAPFEVTANSAVSEGQVLLTLSGEETTVQSGIRFSIFAPGAAKVFLDSDADHDDAWDGDCAAGNWDFAHGGLWHVFAGAVYPDGSVAVSDTFEVNVTSEGDIGYSELNVPAIVKAGEDLEISYSEPENLSELDIDEIEYSLSVSWWNGEEDIFVLDETHNDASEPFVVNGYDLDDGWVYNVHYFVGTPHRPYVSYESDFSFLVVDDPENYADERAILTVNEEGGEAYAAMHEDFNIRLEAPGMTAARVFDGDGFEDMRNWGEWEEWQEQGWLEYSRGHGYNRRAMIYAEVCFDEDPDAEDAQWVRSNAVVLNVYWNFGALSAPTVELENSAVARGDFLTIHVSDIPEGTEWTNVDVEDALTGEWRGWWPESDGLIRYPTGDLEPGAYRGRVHCGAPGLFEGNTFIYFTVLENESNEIQLLVEPETVETHQSVNITLFAPGAVRTQLVLDDGRDESSDSECASGSWDFDHAREAEVVGYAWYEVEGEEEWREETVTRTFEITAEGDVEPPTIITSYDITSGEDLTFSIEASENADWYWAFVEDTSDWNAVWEQGIEPDETYTVPGDRLRAGHIYRVNVHAGRRGLNYCDDNYADVMVVGESDERLVIRVNGMTEEAEAVVNTEFTVTLESEGATAVRFYNGNEFEDRGAGYDEFGQAKDYCGEYRLFFLASFDEDPWAEDAEWGMSNIVYVNMGSEGALGPIDFSYPDTVERGDDLIVTINSLQNHNEWYGAEPIQQMWDHDEWLGYHHWDEENQQIVVPTTRLEPGDYKLFISSAAEGWESVYEEVWFTVVPSEQRRVTLELDRYDADTQESVWCFIYAPGADSVELCEVEGNVRDWCEGESYAGEHGWDHSGEYEIWAAAWYGEDRIESEHYNLNIYNPNGNLNDPWFALEPVIMAGEDVTIETGVENARWYNYSVWDAETGNPVFDQGWDADEYPGSAVIPADQFEVGRRYYASVYASAPGFNNSYFEREFIVAEGYSDAVTLTVNGSADDQTIQCNESFRVAIEAEGATAYRFYNGDDWWDWDTDLSRMAGFYDGRGNTGEYNLYAQVYFGEVEDYTDFNDISMIATSAPVHVTFTAEGDLNEPEFSMPGDVTRGDNLVLTNIGNQGLNEWYDACIQTMDGDEVVEYLPWDADTRTITLPTVTLEPGDYRVQVNCSAVGYQTNGVDREFTVNEPEAGEPIFRLSKDVVTTHEEVVLQAYVPGAAWIEFRCRNDGHSDRRDGESGWTNWSFDHADLYSITVVAHFYDDEGNEDIVKLEPRSLSVTSNGALTKARIHTPALVYENKDITIGFEGVEGAEHYHVELICVEGTDSGDWEFIDGFDVDEPGEFTYNSRFFSANRIYLVNVSAWTYGMDSSYSEKRFMVARDSYYTEPVLTVNGSIGDVEVEAHEDIYISINTPGATALRVLLGDHWEYYNTRDEYIPFEVQASFGSGDHVVLAQASYDGYDPENFEFETLNWQWPTNGVNVHAASRGVLGRPEVGSDESVARGQMLHAHIGEVENATWYDLRIMRRHEDEDWNEELYYQRFYHGGFVQLPTAMLESGDGYFLSLWVGAPGFDDNGNESEFFTVTDPTEDISFSIEPLDVVANEEFAINAYVPGAARMAIVEKDEYDGNRCWEEDTDVLAECWSRGTKGDYTFALEYTYDGENWERFEKEYTVHFSSEGSLGEPWIEAPNWVESDIHFLTITVHSVENAESYWFDLEDENGNWFYHADVRPDVPKTFPVQLQPGYEYRVHATASAMNMENGYSEHRIVTVGGNDGAIGITVNGKDGEMDIPVNEDVTILVNVPVDAEHLRVYNGEYYWEYDPEAYRDGTVEEVYSFGYESDFTLYAKYTREGMDQEFVSNAVVIHAQADGAVAEPVIEYDDVVTRGELLEVQVNNMDEHAAFYDAEVTWGPGLSTGWYRADEDGVIRIPTAELPVDEECSLHVDANGTTGWESRSTWGTFRVVEPEGSGIRFIIDKTEVLTSEDYAISVYAPGADSIRLLQNGEECALHQGDGVVWRWSDGHPGVLEYTVEAQYGEDWVTADDSHTVTVTAPYGRLGTPRVEMPNWIYPGEDMTFTVYGVENGEHYWVDLNNQWGDNLDNWDVKPGKAFTIPADRFEDSQMYRLSVHVNALGYENSDEDYRFIVAGDPDGSIELTVNGSTEGQSFQVNEEFEVKMRLPEGATAARLCWGEDTDHWDYNRESIDNSWTITDFCSRSHSGSMPLYARYTYDEYDEYTDWNELNWSATSNIISLTFTKEGQVPEPEVEYASEVSRGEMLEVRVLSFDEHVDFYDAALYSDDTDKWTDWYRPDGDGVIRVPTADLETGTYRLCVSANGIPGWQESNFEAWVEIIDSEDAYFVADRYDVLTTEDVTLSAFMPGAQAVRLLDGYGNEFAHADGEGIVARWSEHHSGEYRLKAEWLDAGQDAWNEFDTVYVINVDAPYGALDVPEVEIPESILVGEDLPVTVYGVDNAQNCWMDLINENGLWLGGGDFSFDEPFVFGADTFVSGEVYTVHVHLAGLGYEGWDDSYRVVTLGEVDGSIAVSVNESDEDQTVQVNEGFDVRIEMPVEATWVNLYIGTDIVGLSQEDIDNGVVTRPDFTYGKVGKFPLFAKYTTDPIDDETDWNEVHWSGNSNIINMTFTKVGDIAAPEVEMPGAVRASDPVHVVVTNLDEHATGYDASIWYIDEHGNGHSLDDWYPLDENGEADVPTDNVPAGDCVMIVISHGEAGYQEHNTEVPFSIHLMPDDPELEILETEVPIFGELEYTVYTTEEPVSIALIVDDEEALVWTEEDITGEENSGIYRVTETGEHTVCVEVTYFDGLVNRSEEQTITVTSQGTAPALEYDLCPSTFPDQGIRIYFWDGLEEDVSVEAWYGDTPFELDDWGDSARLKLDTEDEPLPMGIAQITLIYEKVGYDRHEETLRVLVADENKAMYLPDSLKEIKAEAFAGMNASLIIVNDGCESIGSKAFAGCANLARVIIPESVTSIAPNAFDGCDYVAIECLYGSYAEQYCADNGIYCDGYGE